MSTIAWVIPRLIEGSGGHRTILQHAYALEQAGYQCPIYIEGTGNQAKAAATVERLFGNRFLSVRFGWDEIQPADLVMATIWYSAAIVRDLPFNCYKGYFVQDYEAMFNPMGDAYLSAENSYRYGLTPITIGSWLKHELANRFKVPAFHINFGVDNRIYHPLNIDRELSVCFIYQPDKPRRCSRFGVEALGIVKHNRPEVNIYLYGSPPSEKGDIWYEHEHLGLLKLEDCNALYNRCAVGLCLSSSNPSRIPFEMMAAGLPVVEFWRENNLYDIPPDAVSLSEQTPESLAKNILRLLADNDERERMSRAGVTFMSDRPLQDESEGFKTCVKSILEGQKPKLVVTPPLYDRPPISAEGYGMTLPTNIRKRLVLPANANLNSLPIPIRGILGWGARTARKLFLNH
ncbi:glycosyltransferase family protein [Endozoicomonas elysicola]|uniref:Glycosyl transferase family 1 n=1 Tax=Endozoicomonas elysicola TaxID=305900 RepID=A0A081KAH0_9GAMM|nr:glycosyltransferase family 4 protein [Endozoicomonas elysicola]KEI71146.1 glycosyl transferase family 1 [Endozoicomonas elysicola]